MPADKLHRFTLAIQQYKSTIKQDLSFFKKVFKPVFPSLETFANRCSSFPFLF